MGYQSSDDINWRSESWMIYLYRQLDDVKRERVVFSITCLCSRRSRAFNPLYLCQVIAPVDNTKKLQ